MPFKKVEAKMSFPKMEEELIKFWEENKIFEKSVKRNPEEKSFIFYEGPPTANGKPGLHHVLARAFKDVIPRYKTMKGFRVERKAGWDTHGLPVEIQVEKALGLHSKQEIENIVPGDPRESIIEFNKKCKESVWEYKDEWEKLTRRMAFWVDMDNPYVTYENKYIESVWWTFAQIAKTKNSKGESLLYKGYKVVPYCYRCGTALSSHEVAQGYQTVKDDSVYIKFKAKPNPEKGINDNTYFLAWTTTPWTLPGNVALAVNKDVEYVKIKNTSSKFTEKTADLTKDIKGEVVLEQGSYILAKDIFWNNLHGNHGFSDVSKLLYGKDLEDVKKDILSNLDFEKFAKKYDIEVLRGEDLLGLEYDSLYQVENKEGKKAHYIISGDFVTTTDGTGIVHIAPAFGEDDANVGKENDLPTLLTVDMDGRMAAEVPGQGLPVKKKNDKGKYAVDEMIIEDLKKRGLFFKSEEYEHEYPFCWRCDTALIYYAKPSWFIRVGEFSKELVRNNEGINWVPEHIKEGRFGEWLRGVKDWAVSRERYWGTPLPIWECQCGEIKVIESVKELEELSGQKLDDLHRPFIDDPKFSCSCGGEMNRVPEVMDVWFDSGSMPLAQFHYPNAVTPEDKKNIETGKYFPADFISEAVDQTRGWFYTLHTIATLLNLSGKVPVGNAFKNVICLGHILDAKGKKMSKSRGNIVDPMQVMDEYGADILRYLLYTINQPGLPKRFDPKALKDILNRIFRMLWNSYSFFVMYANIDKWQPETTDNGKIKTDNLLDRWILSELNILIRTIDEKLDKYDVYNAAYGIEKFVDNLSNWYIRRSRKRFWKSENDDDKNQAYATLHYVLVTLSKLMAPFTPFIAEEIYRNLVGCHSELDSESQPDNKETLKQVQGDNCYESVHLCDFPVADDGLIDKKLNDIMVLTREVVNIGLKQRAEARIKVRQPLEGIALNSKKYRIIKEHENHNHLFNIITEELNIKGFGFNDEVEDVMLNTEITPELRLEGQAREVIRYIQEMRKEAGYEVDNRIKVCYTPTLEVFEKFKDMIAKEVLADELSEGKLEDADLEKEFDFEEEKFLITIKR